MLCEEQHTDKKLYHETLIVQGVIAASAGISQGCECSELLKNQHLRLPEPACYLVILCSCFREGERVPLKQTNKKQQKTPTRSQTNNTTTTPQTNFSFILTWETPFDI